MTTTTTNNVMDIVESHMKRSQALDEDVTVTVEARRYAVHRDGDWVYGTQVTVTTRSPSIRTSEGGFVPDSEGDDRDE